MCVNTLTDRKRPRSLLKDQEVKGVSEHLYFYATITLERSNKKKITYFGEVLHLSKVIIT